MAVIKNTPIRLNRDDDVRRLEPIDMSYALNVNVTKSQGRDEGVLENLKGNTEITNTLPAGNNKCIGVIVHEQSNNLFYFIWNSNNLHSIYYINDVTEEIRLVVQSSVLNFNKNGFVVGEAYLGRSSEEILLYFTDNINPPRKVNVQKMLNNAYTTITDEVINLVKLPPSDEPTWEYTADNSVVYNNVFDKNFQFRYRYLYDDGEVSAYSSSSSITWNDKQILGSVQGEVDFYNDLNNIKITVSTGSELVKRIEVIRRNGNNGEWRLIKTLDNDHLASDITFDHKNDGEYPAADAVDTNKLFDNVPIQAEAISILNSRIFLGNYIDGYDQNEDLRNLREGQTAITLNARSKNYNIPLFATATESFFFINSEQLEVSIDYSSLTPVEGDTYLLNQYISIPVFEDPPFASIRYVKRVFTPVLFETYEVQNGDTISDVLAGLTQGIIGTDRINSELRRETSIVGSQVKIRYVFERYVEKDYLINYNSPSQFQQVNFRKNSGKYGSLDGGPSFKKGSKYSLGIIEYDEAGRSSTVNLFPDNDVYIPFITEAIPNTKDMIGEMSIDYRIDESIKPSLRSHKWQWCITENTSIGEFVQYSVSGAYGVANSDYPNDDTVYLNIRGLQSQPSSYVTAFDAEPITYNYVDGDRLRVISYMQDVNGTPTRVIANGLLDFRITSGRIYGEEDSPIFNSNNANHGVERTGYILGVQPIGETGWGFDATSFWNNSNGSVIVEIYRPKAQGEEETRVFFEIGGKQNVLNPGTANRAFSGQLRDQGEVQNYNVFSNTLNTITIDSTSVNYVIGDLLDCINISDVRVGGAEIEDIQQISGQTVLYVNYQGGAETIGNFASVELASEAAAGNLTDGDVWVRPRNIRNDNDINNQSYIIFPIEDYNVLDFIPSRSWSKGRANAFAENAKEIRRFSSVTYSDPYFNESNVNGFSTFNTAQLNFKQYNQSYGAIHRMYPNNGFLVVFQENKIGRIPVELRVISTAAGENSLTLSQDLLNEMDYYKGDYGLTKAESFVAYDGDFYGWDIKKAKVWELGASGIQLVSDNKFSTDIEEESKALLSYYKTVRLPFGLDREFERIHISSVSSATKAKVTDGSSDTGERFPDIADDGTNLRIKANQEKSSSDLSKSSLARSNEAISELDIGISDLGLVRQNLNLVPENGSLEYTGNVRTSGTEEAIFDINIGGTNRIAKGTYDFSTSEIIIPKAQQLFSLAINEATELTYSGFTAGYNSDDNIWTGFYSFLPEMYGSINYSFYSFRDGAIWKHNTNDTYNNFYGTQYDSVVEVNFNQAPSTVKVYDAMSIEGNTASYAVTFTTNLNTSSIPSGFFIEKEGFYHTMLPRTSSKSNFSNIIGGGTGTFTGSNLTITGLDVYSLGVNVGTRVVDSTGAGVGTVTAIVNANTVTVSAGSGSGFFYFEKADTIIEGDRLRGYHMTTRLTYSGTDFIELFSVNAKVTESSLHNT